MDGYSRFAGRALPGIAQYGIVPARKADWTGRRTSAPSAVISRRACAGRARAEKHERLLAYRWENAHEALLRLAEVENDPFDDVILQYVEPSTGASVLPCIAAYLQMIRPGRRDARPPAQQQRGLFCVQGSGTTEVDGTSYHWSKGDVLVIAPSAVHKHSNPNREPAILFSFRTFRC